MWDIPHSQLSPQQGPGTYLTKQFLANLERIDVSYSKDPEMTQVSDEAEDSHTAFDTSESDKSESEYEDTSAHGDTASDSIPSETSEDRAFVVSDTESQSSPPSESEVLGHLDEDMQNRGIKPIKVIAKRFIAGGNGPTTEYLVLWYSWEKSDRVQDMLGDMISGLHID